MSVFKDKIKSFIVEGTEYLTRLGVKEEFGIAETSFYRIVHKPGMRYCRHPSYGICVKREWLRNYFDTQKFFKK